MDALDLLHTLQTRFLSMQDRALTAEARCRRLQDELARRGVSEEALTRLMEPERASIEEGYPFP